jgi:tetratricopeptide (TPR) repeat protein
MTSDVNDPAEQVRRLNELVGGHYRRGEFDKAIALNKVVLKIIHDAGGAESPVAAEAWRSQARLLGLAGRRAEQVAALGQIVSVERAIDQSGSRRLIDALSNLGAQAEAIDDLGTAADSFREAAKQARERFGTEHSAYALSINNLAGLYDRTGDLVEAERLFKAAQQIWSEQDPDDRFLARSLDSLGALYYRRSDYLLAFETFQRAESLWTTIDGSLGERATNLNNQAAVIQDLSRRGSGQAAERHGELAEQLREQVLDLYRQPGADDPQRFAEALDSLGVLHLEMGRLQQAEDEITEANALLGELLGRDSSGFARSLRNLALLKFVRGLPKEGRELLDRASRITDREFSAVFALSSDRQRLALVASRQFLLDVDLSVLLSYFADDPAVVRSTFDTVLRRKGLATEALVLQRESVRRGRRPELVPQPDERDATKRQLARLLLAPVRPGEAAERENQLSDLSRRIEDQEIVLSKSFPGIAEETGPGGDEHQRIAATMPSSAALVEFVRMRAFDFQAATYVGSPWRGDRYLAFVLTPSPPEVGFVDLGEAAEIDKLVSAFRAAITGRVDLPDGRGSDDQPVQGADSDQVLRSALLDVFRGYPTDGDGAAYDTTAGTALRKAVLDPLLPHLGGRTRVILSPDSTLALFPFEALTLDDDSFAVDEFALSYVSVGRDILRRAGDQALRDPSGTTQPVVLADPDFDLAEQPAPIGEKGVPFAQLPGARAEGLMTAAELGVKGLVGPTATKKEVDDLVSPRVLHLATHGFFFASPGLQYDAAKDHLSSPMSNGLDRLARLASASLRSGLALASANTWVHGRPVPAGAGNGILTAEEISSLDLIDTELVVLSACETGLGETQVGEGVFGLRRAFALTGADSLVMSLWRVSDDATRDLMREFYERLRGRSTVSEALRDAQTAIRQTYPHPRHWAAFVSAGEDRPVRVAPADPDPARLGQRAAAGLSATEPGVADPP